MSDVALEKPLPTLLEGAAARSCCIGGALSVRGYERALSDAGFEVLRAVDHSDALIATIEQVRRRLSLFEVTAVASGFDLSGLGVSSEALETGRTVAAMLVEEVRNGVLGYTSITARKPGPGPSRDE